MLIMTSNMKYLTPHVILGINKEIYQNGGWGALSNLLTVRKAVI